MPENDHCPACWTSRSHIDTRDRDGPLAYRCPRCGHFECADEETRNALARWTRHDHEARTRASHGIRLRTDGQRTRARLDEPNAVVPPVRIDMEHAKHALGTPLPDVEGQVDALLSWAAEKAGANPAAYASYKSKEHLAGVLGAFGEDGVAYILKYANRRELIEDLGGGVHLTPEGWARVDAMRTKRGLLSWDDDVQARWLRKLPKKLDSDAAPA